MSRWIQSCITTIGFPSSVGGILNMVEKNRYLRDWATDLDTLLEFDLRAGCRWSAPKWLTTGDILFFYHTKTAKRHVAMLTRETEGRQGHGRLARVRLSRHAREQRDLVRLLRHAADLADRYSGTIFGCGEIGGPPEYLEDKEGLLHFKGRVFAPLARVHIFGTPLGLDDLSEFVRIKRQGTITPLGSEEFQSVKRRLSESNELPQFLCEAEFGEVGFRNIDGSNWAISCAGDTVFIHEAQIRAYLFDFLLDELRDEGSPLLQECECFRGGEMTGRVDYFVKLHGCWVPFEAKLNILSERELGGQLGKYIHVDSFVPTKGTHRGRVFQVKDSAICLVGDQSGVYITSDGEFRGCSRDVPVWTREELAQASTSEVRDRVLRERDGRGQGDKGTVGQGEKRSRK